MKTKAYNLDLIRGWKKCKGCLERFTLDNFYVGVNKSGGTYLNKFCKTCSKAIKKINILKNHGFSNALAVNKKYNITKEERNKLFTSQNELCAICRKSKATDIDHNHKTGEVRAMLCGNCNKGIGFLKDDFSLVYEAYKYLLSHDPYIKELESKE